MQSPRREILTVHEQDALGNFDESGTDPVSAAFAQIQSAHQGANNSPVNNNDNVESSNVNNNNVNNDNVNDNNDNNNDNDNDNSNDVDATNITRNTEQNGLNSSADHVPHEDVNEQPEHQQHPSVVTNDSRDLPGPSAQRTSLQKIDLAASVDLTDYLKTNSPREVPPNVEGGEGEETADMSRDVSASDMNDVLETLYQKAIEDMASRAFNAADVNKDGKISFEVRLHLYECLYI